MSEKGYPGLIDLLPESFKGLAYGPASEAAASPLKPEDNNPVKGPITEENIRNVLALFASASSRVNLLRLQDATRWACGTFTPSPSQGFDLVGRDRMRKTLIIQNNGTKTLWISPNNAMASVGGAGSFPVLAGDKVTLNNTSEVSVVAASDWVDGETISYITESYEG
jgi:hypothetical protein